MPFKFNRKIRRYKKGRMKKSRHSIHAELLNLPEEYFEKLHESEETAYYCEHCRHIFFRNSLKSMPGGFVCPECEVLSYVKKIIF